MLCHPVLINCKSETVHKGFASGIQTVSPFLGQQTLGATEQDSNFQSAPALFHWARVKFLAIVSEDQYQCFACLKKGVFHNALQTLQAPSGYPFVPSTQGEEEGIIVLSQRQVLVVCWEAVSTNQGSNSVFIQETFSGSGQARGTPQQTQQAHVTRSSLCTAMLRHPWDTTRTPAASLSHSSHSSGPGSGKLTRERLLICHSLLQSQESP